MRRLLIALLCLAALALPAGAQASPYVRYGIQDDAWLEYGPGTLDERLAQLNSLGVEVERVTLDWSATEPRRGVWDWSRPDLILRGLHAHGIAPLVTLYGTPGWANGGRGENWAPTNATTFAAFARAVAQRYPFVRLWTVWNEPNQQRSLRPTSPAVYVQRLLNPAYAAIHAVSPSSQVAGGVTAPRAASGGVSPVAWIFGMAAAHARLDAYAHNPYPLSPRETPTSGGCAHCSTITMATLPRLLADVQRAFGVHTRIWLTEYGYQTNPPDALLGVSYAQQARYLAEAALRAYEAPRVDLLIQYLVRDEPTLARWQSGLETLADRPKPAYRAFQLPLAERSRSGLRTVLWGQVRAGGRSSYRLEQLRGGTWHWVGGLERTDARGFFTRTMRAGAGSQVRIWSQATGEYSVPLTIT